MRLYLYAVLIIFAALVLMNTSAWAALAEINEDVLMRHNDVNEAHDRQASAEIARERTKAALNHARFVFELDSGLYQRKAIPRWDLLQSRLRLLQAALSDRLALFVINVSGLEMRIQTLRASWRDGSAAANLSQLAALFVEKRQMRVDQSEANQRDLSEIEEIRRELHGINESLSEGRYVSAEARHESKVNAEESAAVASIASRELDQARQALVEAQRDLEAIGSR
jgi:hypothetical protein